MWNVDQYTKKGKLKKNATPKFQFFLKEDYDECYISDLNDTIKMLEEELKTEDKSYPEYEYHASW